MKIPDEKIIIFRVPTRTFLSPIMRAKEMIIDITSDNRDEIITSKSKNKIFIKSTREYLRQKILYIEIAEDIIAIYLNE
jgi:hypothetical protein